jgi:hypothetical protein
LESAKSAREYPGDEGGVSSVVTGLAKLARINGVGGNRCREGVNKAVVLTLA